MNLYQVRTFAAVAKHKNETKAAQELHLSQSALSHHLKDLQDHFGNLSNRTGRGLELTERGEAFYSEIQPILAQIDTFEGKYSVKVGSEELKPVSVGGSYGPATLVLPSLIAQYRRLYPSIEIDFAVRSSPDIQDLVVKSKVDLAVITNPVPSASLEMEPFKTFQLCFFVAVHHPLATTKRVSVDMLAHHSLIIGRVQNVRSRTDELLGSMMAKGLKLDVVMRCEWPDAVKTLVRQGEGVGILYRDLVEQGVKAGRFKIINVAGLNLSVISYIVYSREKSLLRNAQDFLGLLRTARENSSAGRTILRNLQSFLVVLLSASFAFQDLTFAL